MGELEGRRARPRVTSEAYTYRRRLGLGELLPALGVGLGVGLVGFYVAKLLLERTPLDAPQPLPPRPPRVRRSAAAAPRTSEPGAPGAASRTLG